MNRLHHFPATLLRNFAQLSVLSLNDNGIVGFDEESIEALVSLATAPQGSFKELHLYNNPFNVASLPVAIQHILVADLEEWVNVSYPTIDWV